MLSNRFALRVELPLVRLLTWFLRDKLITNLQNSSIPASTIMRSWKMLKTVTHRYSIPSVTVGKCLVPQRLSSVGLTQV